MSRSNRGSATSRGVRHTTIGHSSDVTTSSIGASLSTAFSTTYRVSKLYSHAQNNARARSAKSLRQQFLQDLTASQQNQFEQLNGSSSEWSKVTQSQDQQDWNDEVEPLNAPEEAHLDALLHTGTHTGRRRPKRSWEERGRYDTANWVLQRDRLVASLLRWRHNAMTSPCETAEADPSELRYSVKVLVIGLFERSVNEYISIAGETYPNETLIRHGCLSSSPLVPSTAFSLDCLRFYRAMRSRCSTYSIESFVKTLADLHNVHFHSYHVFQLTRAFVIYDDLELNIMRDLDKTLGRVDPDWRMRHGCPACSYELKDEPLLQPRKMFSMDGNNSLKRLLKGGHGDVGSHTPSYFLSALTVDAFQNEVSRVRPPTPEVPQDNVDKSETEHKQEPFSSGVGPTDSELLTSTCANNWRAAQAQQGKKTSKIFDETGVFLACCRRGMIAIIVDMIRSGELAKYPMAIFKKLVEVHGKGIVIAYDIACSFFKTLMRSATLGPLYESSGTQMIVPAFHAYAHNRLCQLSWHPLWQRSLGLEDFEWCEHVFSSSNSVARCTRHASRSMRHRFVELHFHRWDADRFSLIGRFLYQNFIQALSVVEEFTSHLENLPSEAQISDEEVDSLTHAEQIYLMALKTEPTHDTLRVEYVTQLQSLAVAESNYEQAWGSHPHTAVPFDIVDLPTPSISLLQLRRSAQQRLNALYTAVERLEAELDISIRWTPSNPEYQEAIKYSKERKYRAAVDRLELLLLQRLFELARLNIGSVGYKLRRHISNALKTRSQAIRTAVTRLNLLAKDLTPPQPPVALENVLQHQFLAEFDFLQICREDVRKERWAQRPVRDAIEARLRIRRAKEEHIRVGIEARRLATYTAHEEEQLLSLAEALEQDEEPLCALEVRAYAQRRQATNYLNKIWLRKLFSHPDFDASLVHGVPKDSNPVPAAKEPVHHVWNPPWESLDRIDSQNFSDVESDLDECEQFAVTDFVSGGLE